MTHRVLEEEAAWREAVDEIVGAGAELVSVSRWLADARTYRNNERLVKIRSQRAPLPRGVATLEAEAALLRRAGGAATAGFVSDAWEYLETQWLPGVSLDRADLDGARRRSALKGAWRAAGLLHAAGVAHRDLRPDNVLLAPDGRTHLIDLGRATAASPWRATIADGLGIGLAPVASPVWRLAVDLNAPRIVNVGRRLRDRIAPRSSTVPVTAPDDVQRLAEAWRAAEVSRANAPGHRTAYYSLTFRDHHLIGERPWYLRWEWISSEVDFTDLRVVELGCNLALLSSFALIHGARSAVGVDHDAGIVASAQQVAAALGAAPRLEVADVLEPGWEERVGNADIVAAMSIVHWLPDPSRVLAYLARQPAVLFEGHEPTEIEKHRLRSLGFDDVRVLGIAERGRAILLGRRSGWSPSRPGP